MGILSFEEEQEGQRAARPARGRPEAAPLSHGQAVAPEHSALGVRASPPWQRYVASSATAHMSDWGLAPERETDMRLKPEQVVREASETVLRALQSTR